MYVEIYPKLAFSKMSFISDYSLGIALLHNFFLKKKNRNISVLTISQKLRKNLWEKH